MVRFWRLATGALLPVRRWLDHSGDLLIRFYTTALQPGELAQFTVAVRCPWGENHKIRGTIIQSTKPGHEGNPAVVWPHVGTRLAVYADALEDAQAASRWILGEWRKWVGR